MEEKIKKIKELTHDLHVSMLTTITEGGKLHSRPMASQEIDEEGNIWFFTHKNTDKTDEICRNAEVNINYMEKNAMVSRI